MRDGSQSDTFSAERTITVGPAMVYMDPKDARYYGKECEVVFQNPNGLMNGWVMSDREALNLAISILEHIRDKGEAMIPVRVEATARPVLATDRVMPMPSDHPLALTLCPVCDVPLMYTPKDGYPTELRQGETSTVVLVFVGIAEEDRKERGWTNGAAVAVHEACAK